MFSVQIDALRSAVKSVLPLVGESYRKSGTGVFCVLQNSLWLVAGNFQSRLGGARVCDDLEGTEQIIDKYFSVGELYQFLGASFVTDVVKISHEKNSVVFKIGRNRRSFNYESVANIAGFINIPPLSNSMVVDDISLLASVAHAAQDEPSSNLHGVYASVGDDIELVATDGFIMSYSKIHNSLSVKTECLIPSGFLHYANRIYWDTQPRLCFGENKVWLFSDHFFATSPTMPHEKYPGMALIDSYRELGYDIEGKVDTIALLDKLNVLGGVDKRDSNVSAVVFEFDDETGELRLLASSKQENGEAEFFIPASGLTDKWIINVHAVKKTSSVLKNMMTSPFISFSRHENGMWMLVRPSNNDNIVFGIVPMRF